MPPQPTAPLGPSAFIRSLSARLNIHAALAGDEEHLLNSIWILLMLLEALLVILFALRSLYRSVRFRFFLRRRQKRVISSRPGTGYSSIASGGGGGRRPSTGYRKVSGASLTSAWDDEHEKKEFYVLGEKDWMVDGQLEYYGGGDQKRYDGNAREQQQWHGRYPMTP
ncbi:hypothetical protein QBC44DRAFT_379257 [Cladorrhinum sp. PSN332]|nr:hypothetical protein QBC44DRAFT_379257 [Cladorrhinum sp. PSN332]